MSRKQVRCHGDEKRFNEIVNVVHKYFLKEKGKNTVNYIADVAGGQGVLSRILSKKYHFLSEVIDPRKYVIKGVSHRKEYYDSNMADYYDLIIGLHPDGALKPIVESSVLRPTILVPCCNYWSNIKMGLTEMLIEIENWYQGNHVTYIKEDLKLNTPYRKCYITFPP